jgi:hypothetical protein
MGILADRATATGTNQLKNAAVAGCLNRSGQPVRFERYKPVSSKTSCNTGANRAAQFA